MTSKGGWRQAEKSKNGFLSVVLDNNYDLPVKPGLQQRDCSLKQRLWCRKMHL